MPVDLDVEHSIHQTVMVGMKQYVWQFIKKLTTPKQTIQNFIWNHKRPRIAKVVLSGKKKKKNKEEAKFSQTSGTITKLQ